VRYDVEASQKGSATTIRLLFCCHDRLLLFTRIPAEILYPGIASGRRSGIPGAGFVLAREFKGVMT
jgi:hypothetical protein